MSVDQIRAALDTIGATPREGFLDALEEQLVAAWTDDAELVVNEVAVGDGEVAPHPRHQRRRWLLVAAATVVVLALGLLAVTELRDPDSVQTDTVPPTPAPSTNPATTTPLPPVDSSPATIPPNTQLSLPPPGEEITVSPDLVEFGDGLLGLIDNMARADGRTYVIAGRYQTETDRLTPPEEAVLAAFDDDGRELWRTELDGGPRGVVVRNGDLWVARQGAASTLTRIDASDGRILGDIRIPFMHDMIAAFDSLWVLTLGGEANPNQVIRVDPDLSTTTVDLQAYARSRPDDPLIPLQVAAGAGAIWVPMRAGGVAMIDRDSLELTVVPVDDIGHEVQYVAVDGDAAYVASLSQVTSIVDRQVLATVSHLGGEIRYLGPMDGAFGVQLDDQRFLVLRANDPMFVEHRQIATDPTSPAPSGVGIASEIGGEAWGETGRNYNLRRFEFLPAPPADG